jgi:hypothetical protein
MQMLRLLSWSIVVLMLAPVQAADKTPDTFRVYHGKAGNIQNRVPRSWLFTFTDGSDAVTARCYLHGNEFAAQGWYDKNDRVIRLSKPFKLRP